MEKESKKMISVTENTIFGDKKNTKSFMPDIPEDKTFIYRILKRALVLDKLRRKSIMEGKLKNTEWLRHVDFHKKDTIT